MKLFPPFLVNAYHTFAENPLVQWLFWLIWKLAPVWIPAILITLLLRLWLNYKRLEFVRKQGSMLLELKLPMDVNKSPRAMEVFFTSLYQTGSATIFETFLGGKVRPWFSLEMVSMEGNVRFFIWTPPKFKKLLEAQLYAQYPGIEIQEVEDYTKHTDWGGGVSMWGTYFKLTKPDPYPIKTYVDYGLDRDPKEEYKIDPIVPVLEFLGSMRRGEQIWIQILIQAHRAEKFADGRTRRIPDWKEATKKEIEKIKKGATMKGGSEEKPTTFLDLSPGQSDTIKALERSLDKFPFETMIRGIYLSKEGAFDPVSITGLIGCFRQFSSNGDLNGFKLGWFTDFDYPWQDFMRVRRNAAEKQMLKAYRLRSFFQPPFKHFNGKPFILNTEELATIYHFPGRVAQTPTFDRVVSRKAEAPSNLPI